MVKESHKLKDLIAEMCVNSVEKMIKKGDEEGFQRLMESSRRFKHVVKATTDDFRCLNAFLERAFESGALTRREFTLISVLMYLLAVEGGACNIINYISYILVIAGHDLYSLTKRKYVKDRLEEIGKVEMSTKIHFLNHHGFRDLTRHYDSTLRNDIAHRNFEIDEDGTLWVRGKAVDLFSKYDTILKLSNFYTETQDVILKKIDDLLVKYSKKF